MAHNDPKPSPIEKYNRLKEQQQKLVEEIEVELLSQLQTAENTLKVLKEIGDTDVLRTEKFAGIIQSFQLPTAEQAKTRKTTTPGTKPLHWRVRDLLPATEEELLKKLEGVTSEKLKLTLTNNSSGANPKFKLVGKIWEAVKKA